MMYPLYGSFPRLLQIINKKTRSTLVGCFAEIQYHFDNLHDDVERRIVFIKPTPTVASCWHFLQIISLGFRSA